MADQPTFYGVVSQGYTFRAQLHRGKKLYYLGSFKTVEEAAAQYDLAVVKSEAYARRSSPLNYPERDAEYRTVQPSEYKPQLMAMLADLRSNLPNAEKEHSKEQALAEHLPEGIEGRMQSIEVQVRALGLNTSRVILEAAKELRRLAGEIEEKEHLLEFYRKQNAELQIEVTRLRNFRAGPKYEFRPVQAPVSSPVVANPEQSTHEVPKNPGEAPAPEISIVAKPTNEQPTA